MFRLYMDVDPLTGKKRTTTRRGFKTKREAQTILTLYQLIFNCIQTMMDRINSTQPYLLSFSEKLLLPEMSIIFLSISPTIEFVSASP